MWLKIYSGYYINWAITLKKFLELNQIASALAIIVRKVFFEKKF